MRRIVIACLCFVATFGLLSSAAVSQDAAPADKPAEKGKGRAAAKEHGKQMIENLAKELKLTDEQRAKVDQIFETHRQAVANWNKENGAKIKELSQQLRDAKKEDGKEKAEAARAEMKKIWETRKALPENLMKQLKEVLTEEQAAKAKEIIAGGARRAVAGMRALGALGRLDLTQEQKDAVKKITDEAKAAAEKAEGQEAKDKIRKDAWEKVKSTVLTEEQRKKLQEMKKGRAEGMFGKLKLTDEQNTQIKAIMDKAREEAKKAEGREAKGKILREAHEKIVKEVLTDKQREQLEEWKKKSGERRAAWRPGAGKDKAPADKGKGQDEAPADEAK